MRVWADTTAGIRSSRAAFKTKFPRAGDTPDLPENFIPVWTSASLNALLSLIEYSHRQHLANTTPVPSLLPAHSSTMPGLSESNAPSYISFQSADLILSDVRPIKLKAEALHSINVFLDEFLYGIIKSAGSLSTDKLRASLLHLLPTSLGKEALLEAEVELRAYWDRTGHIPPFWAYELMQLKCVAYSTLNESDEDQGAEARINEKMAPTYGFPPKPTLVAPAALYLTAILEAMCEHILSNVGAVTSRDSSKTSATTSDLFTALCEDVNIYNLFMSMKVYDQIKQLSTPRERRSKSFSTDPYPVVRTSSPAQDLTLGKSSSNTRSRLSADGSTLASPTNSISRSSFEKARVMKKLMNSKASSERESDSQTSHKRSGSLVSVSEYSKPGTPFDDGERSVHDEAMQQEFDDLMRSSSTMKVSLTPERLKTMEVHKQEKDRRALPLLFKSDSEVPPSSSHPSTIRPSFRHVDSIIEEETSPPKQPRGPRARQASVATPTNVTAASATASGGRHVLAPHRTNPPPSFPKALKPSSPEPPSPGMPSRNVLPSSKPGNDFPPRTRVRQRNRESIDLDDIMNGSDEDEELVPPVQAPPRTSSKKTVPYVSASTRELIDFLAEGPPEPKVSKGSRDLVDFLAQGPPDYSKPGQNSSAISLDSNSKRKAGGRLQRMMSKLSIGNGEKSKNGVLDSPSRSTSLRPPPPLIQPTMQSKPSVTTLSSLANRPIPPRPPRPPSPPSSDTHSVPSIDDKATEPSLTPSVSENTPTTNGVRSPLTLSTSNVVATAQKHAEKSTTRATPHANDSHGQAKDVEETTSQLPIPPVIYVPQPQRLADVPKSPLKSPSIAKAPSPPVRKPVPMYIPEGSTKPPPLSESDILDIYRLLSRATTADECRLIFDMVVARRGLKIVPKPQDGEASYPSPSPTVQDHKHTEEIETTLENSMVELLLGGTPSDFTPGDDNLEDTVQSTVSSISSTPQVGMEPSRRSGSASHTPDTSFSSHITA
ncbi:hypothetical protein BDQ17DRAFT_1540472 [Cyathus striatus]|nr:hypothetical protein BDQ17DRAFT_1540472 [Cyathus striatus]